MNNTSRPPIVLASASPFRQAMLANVGVDFAAHAARLDERAAEAPLIAEGAEPADIALVLAIAKADEVSSRHAGAVVIGSDQTLAFEGEVLHKAENVDEGRRRLIAMSGKTHRLHSAAALVRDGETLWSHVETAHMTMRRFDAGFVGRYAAAIGDDLLASVGGYQIEGLGAQLFERIEGDFFSIIGLPLLPLLAELRARDFMDH